MHELCQKLTFYLGYALEVMVASVHYKHTFSPIQRCFDGGFSSILPRALDPNVVTVSPYNGGCDICPQGESESMYMLYISGQPFQISMKNIMRLSMTLRPTSWEELEELFLIGYKNTVYFLKREGE